MKLIKGNKKERKEKSELYTNAFLRFLDKVQEMSFQDLREKKKLSSYIFLGVKNICSIENRKERKHSPEFAHAEFYLIETLIEAMTYITPRELLEIFPPEKNYDGAKWQTKDYFTTMQAMREYGLDKQIEDEETVTKLLWDYMNWDINIFMVEWMSSISEMSRLQTGKDPWVEFMNEQGVSTYYEQDGYLIDSQTGEKIKVTKAKKRVPKHWKVIESEEK